MTTDQAPAHPSPAPRGDALVMFGLTGDLGHKKLFPAIYELIASGTHDGPIIGVGRSEYSDDDLLEMYRSAVADADIEIDADVIDRTDLSYVQGDSAEADTYTRLAERLSGCDLPVVYGALPPDLHQEVARQIAARDLSDATRLVIEKPFGEDADTARRLWSSVTDSLDAGRVFIVDHFLAKGSVENMSTVRSSNALIDNNMCAQHVSHIEVVMHESGGVDGRGSFYESVGAIDDVVQSHLLQTLALVTMEAPDDDGDEAFLEARRQAFCAFAPADPATAVLGQFDGYRDVEDVDDDSTVETYVSFEMASTAERWRGVPITVTTGKTMATDRTEVIIHLYDTAPGPESIANAIRFGVKPNSSVVFDLAVLDPDTHTPTATSVTVCTTTDHGQLGDYAVMLDNALAGERRHFAQIDEVIEAWRVVAPLKQADLRLQTYPQGSDGPSRSEP